MAGENVPGRKMALLFGLTASTIAALFSTGLDNTLESIYGKDGRDAGVAIQIGLFSLAAFFMGRVYQDTKR